MSSWPLVKPWAVSGEDADGPCLACLFRTGIGCRDRLYPFSSLVDMLNVDWWREPTSLIPHFLLVSWRVFLQYIFFFFFCWWPTSCVNEGKQADKLHTISMYSSKAQWLLKCSLFRRTDVTTCHISWLHVQTIQLIAIRLLNISAAHSVCYEYVLEKCLPICAEPSSHLNQMTISTFFLVCPFCVRMPPLSC